MIGTEPTTAYLFCHFTGTERKWTDEQLYFAVSRDGLHWTDLRPDGTPALVSDIGERGVRDPYLVRDPRDGRIWLLATDLSIYHRGGDWPTSHAQENGSTNLLVWSSMDLAHWEGPWPLDVASRIPQAGMAWAPEAVWDDEHQCFIVFWATASGEDNELGRLENAYYATTTDFRTASDPVKWIDRERACFDASMLHVGDWWYRASSGDGKIHIDRARNPYAISIVPTFEDEPAVGTTDGSVWEYVGTVNQAFDDFNAVCGGALGSDSLEGPELFLFNDKDAALPGRQRMPFGLMGDRHATKNGYIAFRTANLSSMEPSDWSAADIDFGVLKKRHGTILPITETEYQAVCAAFQI